MNAKSSKNGIWLSLYVLIFALIWINSFVSTINYQNWILENLLVVLFLVILITTYKRFQFSTFAYFLICLFMCMHVYGSEFSYSENPIGYFIQDQFHTSRNHYDRIVHFSFGFLLSIPIREMMLKSFQKSKWILWYFPIMFILSISAMYEIVEWIIADVFFPEQGIAFLGVQGDVWDAQKDTALAFLGSLLTSTGVSLVGHFKNKTPDNALPD